MVDVEQRPLRAFEQQVGARPVCFVQGTRYISHQRRKTIGQSQRVVMDLRIVDRRGAQIPGENEVVEIQRLAQFCREAFGCHEVLQTYGAAGHLVLVRGPDAATRRADLARAP